ncbi:hypothetical protein AAG906_001819 [Vitis piasezkii]
MEKISILGFLLVILCLITRDLACKAETLEGNCLRDDREALLDFKNGLKDSSNNRLSSWIGGNCCQWEGVGCENNTGVVISINLHNPYYLEEAYENWSSMNLSGEIRPSLIELKYLRSLDLSGNSFEHIPIPKFFGSLKNLQYLNLSNCGFRGAIPPTLGNLSNLQFLDLSSIESRYLHLKLNYVNLSMVGSHWMEVFNKLSFLTELHLQHCGLFGSISSLNSINFTSLSVISIGGNSFWSKFPIWLLNLSSLVYIDVSSNKLYGQISPGLGELPNLQHLDLSENKNLTGSFSEFLEEIKNCSSKGLLPELRYLDLSGNQLVGRLPERLSQLEKLTYLDLSDNKLQGPIPASFGTFKNLNKMWLGSNELNGSLPVSFGQLSELVVLEVSWNRLTGILSEEHFSKLSKVKTLWMHGNSGLILNVSSTWIPSFQITDLSMASCNLGPSFPTWLRSQKEVSLLDLSNASISGSIPKWFWNISFTMQHLLLYHNQLQGVYLLDLSYNKFSGPIPLSIGESMLDLHYLLLSKNQITGTIPNSIGHITSLQVIDFSRNNLIGSIPYTINNCSSLISLGQLQWLESLHLNDNKLIGELPSSFQNLSRLELLDLSYNQLSGKVPSWIGTAFIDLVILNLRSNVFFGRLPSQFSNLSSLHVLDLAQNNLMGEIPVTLVELKAMAQEYNMNIYPLNDNASSSWYEERLVVIMKGQSLEYTRTLSLVVGIDLSHNNLSGDISMLHQLSSLDLSSNKLSGTIPLSMPSLTFLSYLNLSNNNFSGKIPFIGQMTTFTESTFVGNPDLCGAPLVTKCQEEDPDKKQSAIEDKNYGGYIDQWFYLSVGLGFAMGILVPYFVLVTRKSWCEAYFDFVDKIVKWLLRRRATYAKDHLRR